MNPDSGDLIQRLLAPREPKEFFQEYFNLRPLHIAGSEDKFRGLFDRAAFERVLPRCPVLKVGYVNPLGQPAEQAIQPSQVCEMLALGRTVCAGDLGAADPQLNDFLQGFSRHLAGMGQYYFNAYLSPDGKGFSLHFDDHPVWILQISGSKRWWISKQPALTAIVSGATLAPDQAVLHTPWATLTRPADADLEELVLSPGDVLYLPTGTWHRAEAIGESLALTLAELCATPLDVVQRAVMSRVQHSIACRDPLPAFWRSEVQADQIPERLRADFDAVLVELRALFQNLTAEDLYRVWQSSRVEGAR